MTNGTYGMYRGENIFSERAVVGFHKDGTTAFDYDKFSFLTADFNIQLIRTPLQKVIGVWLATDLGKTGTNYIAFSSDKLFKLINRKEDSVGRRQGYVTLDTTLSDGTEVIVDYETEQILKPIAATYDRKLHVSVSEHIDKAFLADQNVYDQNVVSFNIFGVNPSVGTIDEDLWEYGATHTFMSTAAALYISTAAVAMGGAVADDGGSQITQTTEANSGAANDMTLTPVTPLPGDAYYFGSANTWSNLEINIGTAAGTTHTLVWEYWDGTDWDTALSDLTDGTTGWSVGGISNVTFTAPSNWAITTVNSVADLYWIRARIDTVGSGQALGTQSWIGNNDNVDVKVEGLDANSDYQTAIVNSQGSIQVEIGTSLTWLRLNKVSVIGATASISRIYIAETDALTQGVPDTATKVHATIEVADQESTLGWFSVPDDYTGYIYDASDSTVATSVLTARLQVREFGSIFKTKYTLNASTETKHKDFSIPILCPAKSDVRLFMDDTVGGVAAEGHFSLVLIKNTYA